MATKKKTLRTKRRLTEGERNELARFAALLSKRMLEFDVTVSRLSKLTALRAETIRSYMAGVNRPTKGSMRRLTLIFGRDLAAPFAGTELAGPDESAIESIDLRNGRTLLIAHVVLPNAVHRQTLELWDVNHVSEDSPPVYSAAKR